MLNTLGRILQINPSDITAALTKRVVAARGQHTATNNTLAQAMYARDALCKGMYDRMFNTVVEQINKALVVKTEGKNTVIGVLDIYGFEIFDDNRSATHTAHSSTNAVLVLCVHLLSPSPNLTFLPPLLTFS